MNDPDGDLSRSDGRALFDAFAWLTYRLFGNSFLVVAGGAVGALTLFLITTTVAWSLHAGSAAAIAGLTAIPVGYVLIARLMRGLTRRLETRRPASGPRDRERA